MKNLETSAPFVAIACGGTGGHLFPGIAVAEELKKCGCKIGLLISPKEIDQQAVKGARGVEIFTLPAVGLQNRNYLSFGWSFWKSLKASRRIFKSNPPDAVLAMGGFTSAPPVLAARKLAAKTFLHESNTIPGRANRFLTRFVDEVFVGFPETAGHLKARKTTVTGTPVRPEFSRNDATVEKCREQLGLDPALPTILVVGGSQGASGLNAMILSTLPLLTARNWQWLHLTGANDVEKVRAAYAAQKTRAVVKTFLAEMDLALRAATVAVSRAGASSLAEMAAVRLPSLLVPFPAAADNHQYFNALAFEKSGAVKLLEQKDSTPEKVAAILGELVENETARSKMQSALAQWHAPNAAEQIAGNILRVSAFAGLSEGSMPAANPQQSSAGAASPQQFSAA
ncbi:MAG TPA: undecaprenyldiphospho-muramoylpentapeptide beta-N-acetylglucosaminyltransferase [Verrucomicrobiae bacterium]|jgi:UDP-N-acetylglucosamine--N-acetylmuramyl-(pentapeptide) pyrophosphoryl-undecaprenol N-acetylglucosamine transferase|nr:undecaprenyldiphospho-muramoylpentapeptide beta-N-acetylglucosaminyltransferase [Verrucomicrobiae bacterium]